LCVELLSRIYTGRNPSRCPCLMALRRWNLLVESWICISRIWGKRYRASWGFTFPMMIPSRCHFIVCPHSLLMFPLFRFNKGVTIALVYVKMSLESMGMPNYFQLSTIPVKCLEKIPRCFAQSSSLPNQSARLSKGHSTAKPKHPHALVLVRSGSCSARC